MDQDADTGFGGEPQKTCVQNVTKVEQMKLTATRQCRYGRRFHAVPVEY